MTDPTAPPDPNARVESAEPREPSGPGDLNGETEAQAPRPPVGPRLAVGPFSLRQVTGAIGVVVVAAVVLTLAVQPLGTIPTGLPAPQASAYILSSPIPGLQIGQVAPELAGTDSNGVPVGLTDLNGNAIRLADLRGKVVWLNFWASWCPPCQSETPILRDMDQAYRSKGLALVGIQVQQTVDDGRSYAQTYGLQYPIGADLSGAVFRTYKVYALPTQFFIDQQGVVRDVINGPLDEPTASSIVSALLGLPLPTLPPAATTPAATAPSSP